MRLAGDIGGTKTLLLLADEGGRTLARERFASADFGDFTSLLTTFLERHSFDPSAIARVVLGVAGPVTSGSDGETVAVTNLPWRLSTGMLGQLLGRASISLVNDLVATAHGLRSIPSNRFVVLTQEIRPNGDATQAIVGLGTGLGHAFLIPGEPPTVMPSEGGHADFAPADTEQDSLIAAARAQRPDQHVTAEEVLAGPSLARLHTLRTGRAWPHDPQESDTPAFQIVKAAVDGDPEARATARMHLRLLASHLANLALFSLPLGGIVLTGGLATRLYPLWREEDFISRFNSTGTMRHLLTRIPVCVVDAPDVALLGALNLACNR